LSISGILSLGDIKFSIGIKMTIRIQRIGLCEELV